MVRGDGRYAILITEDKADRDRLFDRVANDRFTVRPKMYEASPVVGWPRKHQLWPCVRLGSGEVWLELHSSWNPGTVQKRKRSLYFLRGHSHEALLAEGQSLVFIYQGVGNEVDEWTGKREAPFTEIKSTAISSARMWPVVQKGSVDILSPITDSYFSGYFIQSCQNCVATGVTRCRLRIFFMNGDYATRRKACPECRKPLGTMGDIFRECPACGYKSYAIDLRSYILEYTEKELAYYRKEVFQVRRDQFNAALKAKTAKGLMKVAPGTKCFLCSECEVGKKLGCENYGGK